MNNKISKPVTNCNNNKYVNPDYYSVVVVQTLQERDNIPCKLRQNGTIAIVVEEGYAQYQIQTKEGFYGVCDNNAWIQIATGDKIFDGNNLIILNDETHKQEYLQSGLAIEGQMIFFVPENKYYKYDGADFIDPFPNKLDKPLDSTMNPDNKLIPVYGQSGGNPEWLPSNTLGKVESVNGVTPIPGTKNIELNLSNIPDDVGYTTDAELTQLTGVLDTRITQVEGINYTWSPTNRTLTLFDISGRQMSQVSLVSLDNEGTDLRYNSTTRSLELYNADNELLNSIPVSDFVGNVGTALQLNSNVLQLKDSQGNVLSSVSFSIVNISGLQAALDTKEPTLTTGATTQYYRGDKTWQVLNKSAVGLPNVDNTSDINKPLSTAQQTAIATKLDKTITTVAAPDATFKYVYLTDETNNVRRMLAGDLGKNIANSSLASIAGAGLKLGSSWTLDTNGQIYSVSNLPDKSADASFNKMLIQNSTGQVAWGNGKTLITNMPSTLTDAEKTVWKTEMNGGWTTNTMSVGMVSPPIININNNNNNTWVLLKGANLNLNPLSFKIDIMNEAGTTVLVTVLNSQVQLYQNGTDLVFYYNFSTLGLGKYKIRLWNGVAYYTTSIFIEIVNNVISFNLSNLTWHSKLYNDLVSKNISISPNSVLMSSDLKNTDNSEFDEAQISTGTVIGTIQSDAIIDINGVPITWTDNFYINFELNCQNNARAGAGITNNNMSTLNPAVILGLWTNDGSWQTAATTAGNISERPNNTYGFNLTIIKRGSIATILLQGESQTTIGYISTINTSENVFFKFFKYINRGPYTTNSDTNGLFIKEAYKF